MIARVPLGEPAVISAEMFSDSAKTIESEPGDVQLVIHPPGGGDDVVLALGDLTHSAGSNDYSYSYEAPTWGDVSGYWKATNPDIVIPWIYEVFKP